MKELDEQRTMEVNSLDIMQNTGIIYHIESVLEMQFMCLIGLWYLEDKPVTSDDKIILVALILEHIFAYLSGFFRKWEIEKYGQMDLNGIYRAPKEYILQVIEIFIDCIIFGFSINSMMK